MNRQAIHAHIDRHLEDHVARVQRWVRQPSVSWDNLGVRECAELVAADYRALGCREVDVIEGRYHPGVWAYYDAGAPKTIHNYCMIDTRTVDPRGWTRDPFGGELTERAPYPRVLYGRGALGAKGPYAAWLNALESIVAVEGTLPVNIAFLAEGEEIMGSPTYAAFVERYADRLAGVSASFCPSPAQAGAGRVTLGLGLKGMIVVELTAGGEAWGHGPRRTVHSQVASMIDSPPFRLAQALATLTEPDGRGCRVRGLEEVWTYRKPLGAGERALLETIADRAAGKDWRDVIPLGGRANVADLRGAQAGIEPLLTWLYGPTLNVAGLRSGFLGPNSGTIPFVVPGTATATLDLRLVVDTPPDEIIARLRRHLDDHGFADIAIEVYAAFAHSQSDPDHPAVGAVVGALAGRGVETEIWPIQAGGGPWTVVPNRFGVPCLRGATVGGGGAGPADEFLVIDGTDAVPGLSEMEKCYVDTLLALAGAL